jgi:adenylate cyclase
LIALLGLVLVTFLIVGVGSYHNARVAADSLASQILDQTASRIAERILLLLQTASTESELTRKLMFNPDIPPYGPPSPAHFPVITSYFYEVMRAQPHFSFLSLGLEGKGEYCHVERKVDGTLVPQECVRNAAGKIERSDYRITNGMRQRIHFDPDWGYDPRTRPYYIAAKEAGRQTWTETYVFVNDPSPDSPGVTCATPVYGADGALLGVISADFNLEALCGFLKGIPVGREGFAVVVEVLRDGRLQLIAHPDLDILIKQVGRDHWLMLTEELKDPRARALMKQLTRLRDGTASPVRPSRFRRAVHQIGEPVDPLVGARFEFAVDDVPYLAEYRRLRGEDLPQWLICTVVPESEIMGSVWRSNRLTLAVGLVTLAIAGLLGWRVSGQVARPLEQLVRETEAIGRLDLEGRGATQSNIREVDRLAHATEEMKAGLRSFQKYVPADLVRSLLATGEEARLGGERKAVTICFADFADFTTVAEKLAPEDLVVLLSANLGILSREMLAAGGTVDKYMGDSIMAFWGAPTARPTHALDACRAALRGRDRLRERQAQQTHDGLPRLNTRFGIHTGEVIVGNIGTEARLNYTVIGNAVNLASRLEGLNKHFRTDIILSDSTYQEARQHVVARPLNWVAVKGKEEAVLVYELLGLRGEVDAVTEEFAELCSWALTAYTTQEWAYAIQFYEQALRLRPDDVPVPMMIARCRNYQARPPGKDWDKAHRLDTK